MFMSGKFSNPDIRRISSIVTAIGRKYIDWRFMYFIKPFWMPAYAIVMQSFYHNITTKTLIVVFTIFCIFAINKLGIRTIARMDTIPKDTIPKNQIPNGHNPE